MAKAEAAEIEGWREQRGRRATRAAATDEAADNGAPSAWVKTRLQQRISTEHRPTGWLATAPGSNRRRTGTSEVPSAAKDKIEESYAAEGPLHAPEGSRIDRPAPGHRGLASSRPIGSRAPQEGVPYRFRNRADLAFHSLVVLRHVKT